MVRFHEISIEHIVRKSFDGYSFNGEIGIDRLEGSKLNEKVPDVSIPGRVNAPTMILTLAGEANIEIDDKTYTLYPNTVMDLTGFQVFRNFLFSDDYKGYNIMLSNRFYEDAFREGKHLTPEAASKKRANPLDEISPEETTLLVNIVERIIWNIERKDHIWQRHMIINEVRNFYMEIGNLIVARLTSAEKEQNLPNNDLLFFKFMQLLQDNCKDRQGIGFYADKLCLTSDYFAKTIKLYTGRNVSDWINDALLRQAKIYLQDPDITVLEGQNNVSTSVRIVQRAYL